MTDERWLPVPGYEGRYEVSDLGWVRGLRCVLKPGAHPDGHLDVALCRGGTQKTFKVHRLVLEAFVGLRPSGQVCRHLDGDPANNRLTNLAWGTQSENIRDAVRHGTHHNATKTECANGHEYTPANTYVPLSGGRRCRACRSAANADYRRRSRAA